ncbi:hypothetical protein ASPFODRAFT_63792 [Aspergillus luchuensis CBS 106.47]|uniref:Uncharacterized protein n=1 Tax=Aspergillus luchuensis (strain CBS 106.47) TaxID=1137211 RepID=A0A1M3T789_ASPLC|nr:hypothetical protein ASPFODRAFT_63792 [Aspergillus luchuensis CBS 106.47]
MGMLTGSRHTNFAEGGSGPVSAHKASDSCSHHGRGTHDVSIGLVAVGSPSLSPTVENEHAILWHVSEGPTAISALTSLVLTIMSGESGCTVMRPGAMSTWPTAIRNNISTRPEQTGAIKGAPNRWLGMNAWRRALQGCGQQWNYWTRSMLSVPWAFMECALAAATARSI